MAVSPGGAFGTCSYDHPRVHATFDSAAAVAWPVVLLDSNWICQIRLLRRTRCERFDHSCRRNDAAAVTDALLHLRTVVAGAVAGGATKSEGCCIVVPRGSRQYSPPHPAKTQTLAMGFRKGRSQRFQFNWTIILIYLIMGTSNWSGKKGRNCRRAPMYLNLAVWNNCL